MDACLNIYHERLVKTLSIRHDSSPAKLEEGKIALVRQA